MLTEPNFSTRGLRSFEHFFAGDLKQKSAEQTTLFLLVTLRRLKSNSFMMVICKDYSQNVRFRQDLLTVNGRFQKTNLRGANHSHRLKRHLPLVQSNGCLDVLANPYFCRFRNDTPYLYRTFTKFITIQESHKCFGRARFCKLVMNNHQIRIIQVA